MKTIGGFRPRLLAPLLLKALERFPVVVLTGARQTGKTTLVSSDPISAGRMLLSLDDFDILGRAQRDPQGLLEEGPRLTLDEVQREPNLLLAIKRVVDRERRSGQFLLTGSANLLMIRRVSESLAGRAVYLRLGPLTMGEKLGRPDPAILERLTTARSAEEAKRAAGPASPFEAWAEAIHEGGYPTAALDPDPEARTIWFDGYVRTYLERDLQEVASIAALVDFQRLMKLAALRIGRLLNQTELARDAGLAQATAHRYLNLLETSLQIVRIPAFTVSRTKRLAKTPKLFWTDVGLGAHLAGLGNARAIAASGLAGAFLENLVLTELLAWRETVTPRPEVLYWRTHAGEEVDFVIERGQQLLPVEVKLATRVSFHDARGVDAFLKEYPKEANWGMVLYRGGEVVTLSDRIVGIPVSLVWRA